jgi:helix-turn-helix protein
VNRDELLRDAEAAPIAELPAFLGTLVEVEERIRLRLRSVEVAPARSTTEPDVNVSVDEAARRLGISPSYVYKNRRTLPFVVKIGRRLVCSTAGLERWRKSRMYG